MQQIIPPTPDRYDEFGRPIFIQRPVPPEPVPSIDPAMQASSALQNVPWNAGSVLPPQHRAPIEYIDPAPASPAMMEQITPPNREDPQFQNSRLRTVLNAIGGGLAGASGGPATGFKVGSALHDMPYNNALQSYDVKVADQARRLGIEKERQRQAEVAAGEGVKERAADAAVGFKTVQLGQKQQEIGIKAGEATSKDTMRKSSAKYKQWQMDNPKLTPWQYVAAAEDDEDKLARIEEVKQFEEAAHPKVTDEQAASKAGAVREAQLKKEMQYGVPLTQAKAGASEQGKLDVTTSPKYVKLQADLARAKSAATLTTNEKDTIRGAQVALQALPDIREQLSQASDALFGDRFKEFMAGTIGKEEDFAPLRLNLGMLQSLVAKLHVGSRGSVHILNHFMSLFNAKQMDRATLAASLPALEKWLVRYSKMPTGTTPADVPDPENETIDPTRPPVKVNGKVIGG